MAAGPLNLLEWLTPDALSRPENSLMRLVDAAHLYQLDPDVVEYNMQHHEVECFCGGEAEVYVLDWRLPPGSGNLVACPTPLGARVALKVRRLPDGNGSYLKVVNEDDLRFDGLHNRNFMRNEVNVLKLLELSGLGDRVPPVLGIVQHPGTVKDPPLFAYVMPMYHYNSLGHLMRSVCDRRVPESVFAEFFSLHRATDEYNELLRTVARCGEMGIMMQDISSNNLLIREEKYGCRLLLADPSMTMRACDLADPKMAPFIVCTWLWGSSICSYKRFDPTADMYSLSFCFLELWLCAEGAPVPLFDLVQMTGVEVNRDNARAFCHALCAAVLKRHASCPGAIVPRIRRELPVSWLKRGRMHRRPAEADMVAAAVELAGVAADAEALGGGLTAESLATPAGEALVARCLRLHERLTSLSQLEPPQGSPLDGSLAWVATHFMAQDHPLVAAMRAAQDPAATHCPSLEAVRYNKHTFNHAVLDAQASAKCCPYTAAYDCNKYKASLSEFMQEYVRRREEAVAVLQTPLPEDLLTRAACLQPLLALPAVAISPAASPSADLSSRTVAGGPGNASPATSGGSGLPSPNKRKRGAEQPSQPGQLMAGTTLRFAASRGGCLAGLPAFRLPPSTKGSNLYAYIAHLSERFRGNVHQLLALRQGPYSALLAASGLQPAQLDSLVGNSGSGDAYIEVSAASFLPGASAADHAAAAPSVFHSSSRGAGGSEQQIECGGGSAEEQARYSNAVHEHLKLSLSKGSPLAYGSSATATVLFRIAAAQLPQGMPWVQHEWGMPAADLAAIIDKVAHLFRKKK
ncbi:serine threonine- kinase PEPKR2-like [Chlorella sorokiniana]|uniref:Serine threonine-kinase PEPKR2-like n=1 Tax=Chlorella sorokiniana TaxID=3076 RepID=A0A2P6TZV9_CHLSO|nr:serine threonine- kinase PEPKR2-like [Chlorella sorokiniana]|eukprot:PRW59599.1 serine threonine- kinase PEPKR2-like [Chlorella sorokiniana]